MSAPDRLAQDAPALQFVLAGVGSSKAATGSKHGLLALPEGLLLLLLISLLLLLLVLGRVAPVLP